MTKAEAKELIKDFVQYTGREVDTYREQIIKDYINDSNRTIKFDDDKLVPLKYKVGDKVRVISNSNGNKFEIGEIVTITQLYEDGNHYKVL